MKTTKVQIELPALLLIAVRPVWRVLRRWWLERLEEHYLISAHVEQQRANEARRNVMYYQQQAALARAQRRD